MSQNKRKAPPRRPVRPAPKPKKKPGYRGALKKTLLALLIAALLAGAALLVIGYAKAHRHYLPTILPEVVETEAPEATEAPEGAAS